MKERTIGIIMNGVTGRMGTNQHLVRSILAIRAQGGVLLASGDRLLPDPILVGRNESKLRALARQHGLERFSTDLEACLRDGHNEIYFDAQRTDLRPGAVLQAAAAGKHIYCEKPPATDTEQALALYRAASEARVKNGVVQDKLWLPGLIKLKSLIDAGYFGRILSVRGEFGYWVFDGFAEPCQRPSWNYRKEDGGGIILDMFCHWRYVLDNLFAPVRAVSCIAATHIDRRVDEAGREYAATAEDAAYATFLPQFLVGRPGSPRRPGGVPGGRDGRLRGGGTAGLLDPARRRHSPTRVEPGPAQSHRFLRGMAKAARQRGARQRLQGPVGAVPAPRGRGRPVPLVPAGRGQGRAAGRGGNAFLAGAALGGPGTAGLSSTERTRG
jgi:predicted dehydrogenase